MLFLWCVLTISMHRFLGFISSFSYFLQTTTGLNRTSQILIHIDVIAWCICCSHCMSATRSWHTSPIPPHPKDVLLDWSQLTFEVQWTHCNVLTGHVMLYHKMRDTVSNNGLWGLNNAKILSNIIHHPKHSKNTGWACVAISSKVWPYHLYVPAGTKIESFCLNFCPMSAGVEELQPRLTGVAPGVASSVNYYCCSPSASKFDILC